MGDNLVQTSVVFKTVYIASLRLTVAAALEWCNLQQKCLYYITDSALKSP